VCDGLADAAERLDVVVVARRLPAAAEVCYLAGVRSALTRGRVTFRPAEADLAGSDDLAVLIAANRPSGVLLCASTQSPWENSTAPSRWTDFLVKAGFGVTLPLQAELALRVGRSITQASHGTWFVNACFPDAVNPLLAAVGIPVLCGIGNGALIAASVQTALGLADQRKLYVLAHHVHLHSPDRPQDEARAWYADSPVQGLGRLLAAQRSASRQELNRVTGLVAALLLRDLMAGAQTDTNLPGPLGLPGGYPVRLNGGHLTLRLPAGLSKADAIALNQRFALREGVVVAGDHITFGPPAQAELRRAALQLAAGFRADEVTAAAEELHRLRSRLRREDPH